MKGSKLVQPKAGSWREVKAIEVTRPCGCVEVLHDKSAIKSKADKLAAKACYSCQLRARQAVRYARTRRDAAPSISIGDYS